MLALAEEIVKRGEETGRLAEGEEGHVGEVGCDKGVDGVRIDARVGPEGPSDGLVEKEALAGVGKLAFVALVGEEEGRSLKEAIGIGVGRLELEVVEDGGACEPHVVGAGPSLYGLCQLFVVSVLDPELADDACGERVDRVPPGFGGEKVLAEREGGLGFPQVFGVLEVVDAEVDKLPLGLLPQLVDNMLHLGMVGRRVGGEDGRRCRSEVGLFDPQKSTAFSFEIFLHCSSSCWVCEWG